MIERKRWKEHLHKCIVDLVLMLLNARSSQRWGCKQRKGTDIELTTWCIEIIIWLYFNLWRLLGKIKIELTLESWGVVWWWWSELWPKLPKFYGHWPISTMPDNQLQTKKILGHKNCCRQRHPMRAATLEIQLSWYYKSTIKGCVIKGLQNWFPSALSFNHKTVLPTWKIVNEDRLKYELTMKGILGMFPPVFP